MLRIYTLIATLQTFVNDRFEGRKDRGATAVEYGLIVGLIAVAIILAVTFLGKELVSIFDGITDSLKKVPATGGISQ